MFTNIILSSLIAGSSLLAPNNYSKSIPICTDNFFKMNSQIMLINSFSLVYTDIFTCTKANYHIPTTNYYYHPDGSYQYWIYKGIEANPIANIFWQKNLWTFGYLCACSINTLAVNNLNSIDKSGISAYIYMIMLSALEIKAITTWIPYNNTPKNLHLNVQIITINF